MIVDENVDLAVDMIVEDMASTDAIFEAVVDEGGMTLLRNGLVVVDVTGVDGFLDVELEFRVVDSEDTGVGGDLLNMVVEARVEEVVNKGVWVGIQD